MPEADLSTDLVTDVPFDNTAFVRFDTNGYSEPSKRKLTPAQMCLELASLQKRERAPRDLDTPLGFRFAPLDRGVRPFVEAVAHWGARALQSPVHEPQ